MHEQLEGERAARDMIVPRAVVGPVLDPGAPARDRGGEAALDLVAPRDRDRLVVRGDERQERALAVADGEGAADAVVAHLRFAGVPRVDCHLEVAALEDRDAAPADDRDVRLSPVGSHLEHPLELHLPAQPLDAARELAPRQLAAVVQVQRLGDADCAVPSGERRFEHVRPVDVAALHVEPVARAQGEVSPAFGIEERAERRGAVHERQREEVDRSVGRDERDGASVTERRVGRYRGEALLPLHACARSRSRERSRVMPSSASEPRSAWICSRERSFVSGTTVAKNTTAQTPKKA